MDQFEEKLLSNIRDQYDSLAEVLPNLVIGLVVLFLFWLISKYVLKILERALKGKLEDALVLRFIIKISRLLMLGMGILAFLNIIGWGKFAAGLWGTAGIGAFILGFAFKDIGEHFLAGFILAFNRPFRVGDTVEMSGHLGSVVGLNLRNTHIKTFDGKDVYIPNGNVIKNPLVNYTIDGFIRKEIVVSIDYDSDQDVATKIVLDNMKRHEDILQDGKAPFVVINNIGKNALELKGLYWLDTSDSSINAIEIALDLTRDILKSLRQKGMHSTGDVVDIKK